MHGNSFPFSLSTSEHVNDTVKVLQTTEEFFVFLSFLRVLFFSRRRGREERQEEGTTGEREGERVGVEGRTRETMRILASHRHKTAI